MSFATDIRGFVSLSIASSLGSIPLHLSTIVVEALVEGEGFRLIDANLVLSAYFFGQLVFALVAMLWPKVVSGISVVFAMCVLTLCLGLAGEFVTPTITSLLWLVAGMASGLLMFSGFAAAADAPNSRSVFSLRLSLAMILAGVIVIGLYFYDFGQSFRSTSLWAAAVTGSIAVLTAKPVLKYSFKHEDQQKNSIRYNLDAGSLMPLLLVFLFFLGLIGFIANAGAYIAGSTTIEGATSLATGVAKSSVGVALLVIFHFVRVWSLFWRIFFGGVLIGSVAVMGSGVSLLIATLAFILLELTLNVKSSVFLGEVSDALSGIYRRAMLFVILAGSLAGPIVAGWFVDRGLVAMPIILATLPVLMVLGWQVRTATGNSRHPNARPTGH